MTEPLAENVRHIMMISGGKDSTALSLYMRDKHPEVTFEYLFCDTHKELPETYEYLARIEAYLGAPITRLESGKGERGFDHYLKIYGDYLPSPKVRWCTKNLKIEPFERYVGDDPVALYVGLRADEPRTGYISTKENIKPVFPFKEDGLVKDDIMRILEESGVGLPKYYEWRSRSGCYFCFYQQRAEWVRLKERHPDLFEKAMEYEKIEEGYTWAQVESLAELAKPERSAEILQREAERKERLSQRKKPRKLSEVYGFEEAEEDPDDSCLICHL